MLEGELRQSETAGVDGGGTDAWSYLVIAWPRVLRTPAAATSTTVPGSVPGAAVTDFLGFFWLSSFRRRPFKLRGLGSDGFLNRCPDSQESIDSTDLEEALQLRPRPGNAQGGRLMGKDEQVQE